VKNRFGFEELPHRRTKKFVKISLMVNQFLDFYPNDLGFHTFLLLAILVALEGVLSADNAIALASIAQGLPDSKRQRQALDIGLIAAFVLRMTLIVMATWVIRYWQFELMGALYLLWLVFQYFTSAEDEEGHHHGPRYTSLWQTIPLIAMTDLAFSLDSVTAAIAISEQTWIILTGATIGIIALRFMAELFIQWLKIYTHLEDAGYITVGFIGLRLLLRVVDEQIVPPEWLTVIVVIALFIWGFSERRLEEPEAETEAEAIADGERSGET
jgi:YkoY family integral membrane protein